MSMNKYMHPRNPYRHQKPKFRELAEKYPFFNEVVEKDSHGRVTLEFKNPLHLAVLSRALLLQDFGLDVAMPLDRLIPTVPLRLNYILWLEDIFQGRYEPGREIHVIDIGVGASCIYPLLGAKKNGWHFVATETEGGNFQYAQSNVERNKLLNNVQVVLMEEGPDKPLLAPILSENPDRHYAAVMCNPPFYCSSGEEAGDERTDRRDPPKSVNCAKRQESQTPGGEVCFVMKLVHESLRCRDRIGVFTAMLGKKRSVRPLKRTLRKLGVQQVCVHEMCQGRVMRWGLAWTFDTTVHFPKSEFQKKSMQERPPLTWTLPRGLPSLPIYTPDAAYMKVSIVLRRLKMTCIEQKNKADKGGKHLRVWAMENTWTHSRRHRREEARKAREQAAAGLVVSSHDRNGGDEGSTVAQSSSTNESMSMEVSFTCTSSSTSPKTTPLKRRTHDASDENSEDEDASPPAKMSRMEEVCAEGDAWEEKEEVTGGSSPNKKTVLPRLLDIEVWVKWVQNTASDTDTLMLMMKWLDGENREAMNQVLCHLKNELSKVETGTDKKS